MTMLAEAGCSNAELAAITGHWMKHVETILTKNVRDPCVGAVGDGKVGKSGVRFFGVGLNSGDLAGSLQMSMPRSNGMYIIILSRTIAGELLK